MSMNIKRVKEIVVSACQAKESSDDPTFAEMLQKKIESFVSYIADAMGADIDHISASKQVPQEVALRAQELYECFAV